MAAEKTVYHVFTQNDAGSFDLVAKNLSANSDEHAKRLHAEKCSPDQLEKGVTLVAVPARSWKPTTVRAERKTVLRFGEVAEPAAPQAAAQRE